MHVLREQLAQRFNDLEGLESLFNVMDTDDRSALHSRPDGNAQVSAKVLSRHLLARQFLDDSLPTRPNQHLSKLCQLGDRPQQFDIFLAGGSESDHRIKIHLLDSNLPQNSVQDVGDRPRNRGDRPQNRGDKNVGTVPENVGTGPGETNGK